MGVCVDNLGRSCASESTGQSSAVAGARHRQRRRQQPSSLHPLSPLLHRVSAAGYEAARAGSNCWEHSGREGLSCQVRSNRKFIFAIFLLLHLVVIVVVVVFYLFI